MFRRAPAVGIREAAAVEADAGIARRTEVLDLGIGTVLNQRAVRIKAKDVQRSRFGRRIRRDGDDATEEMRTVARIGVLVRRLNVPLALAAHGHKALPVGATDCHGSLAEDLPVVANRHRGRVAVRTADIQGFRHRQAHGAVLRAARNRQRTVHTDRRILL